MLASQKESAWQTILKSLESIAQIRQRQTGSSVVLKQFFDVKYKEIGDVFSDYPKRDVFDRLSMVDPEHRSSYQELKVKP